MHNGSNDKYGLLKMGINGFNVDQTKRDNFGMFLIACIVNKGFNTCRPISKQGVYWLYW